MRTKRIVTAMMAGCAAVVMSAVPGLAAQTPPQPQHAATDKAEPDAGMAAKDKAMMAEREKMMAAMKAADQRLDSLVVKMNSASGMEKMAATATVVTEMATQRRTMQEGMMGLMLKHMQAGKDSMAMSPMMKPMGSGLEHADATTQLSKMTAEQKKREQEYFRSHSFDFSSIFSSRHPGPYWILENAKQFQLSSEQIKHQEDLKFGMAKSTIAGNTALQRAYEQYASDASAVEPSLAAIKKDIEAIGKAQTNLALVMVPYHLRAYSALTPAQQTLYRKLVAERK